MDIVALPVRVVNGFVAIADGFLIGSLHQA
jgi:hypothetical protein